MQNQPGIPIERGNENQSIIARFFKQPNEEKPDNAITTDELQSQENVLYECSFCDARYS